MLSQQFETQGNWLFKYRGVLPILVLAPALAVFYNNVLKNSVNYKTSFWLFCFGISIIGLLIRFYTVGHAAPNTSGRNTQNQLADSVNTTGIYSLVRHPLYIGNFFMWLGLAFLVQNVCFIVFFIVVYWWYYERIMYAEEQFLHKKFKEQYSRWALNTNTLLPNFNKYIPNAVPFQWAKALRQEKTGALLLCLIYFAFYQIQIFIKTNDFEYYNVWTLLLIFALGYYIFFKIKK